MLELKVQPRQELGKKVKHLREAGEIPAVLYGHNIKPISLKVSEKDFQDVYKEAGESSIITLKIGAERKVVLIYGVQRDPVTDKIIHADFYQVKMDEKIITNVPLEFIGVSPAVKEKGGILVKNMHEIEVEAFPQDLLSHIEVDISSLAELHSNIYVKDLLISSKARILAEPNEIVASVVEPKEEKEEVPAPAEEEITEKAVSETGEEVEGTEGQKEQPVPKAQGGEKTPEP